MTEISKFQELKFLLDEWYFDHIAWRIRHYWFHEKCETCRNWHYCGKFGDILVGRCDWERGHLKGSHGYCTLYNDDYNESELYTFDEDGWEMPMQLPSGKWITVRSKSGHWQYLYDGMPKWYEE